jgi:hypothetical protein
MPGNDPRASNHSVVTEEWVCAWPRPQTVRVRHVSLGKNSKRVRTWQGHETLRWPIGRWRMGRRAPRQANWVKITPSAPAISKCSPELSRRIDPGHLHTQRGQQTSEFNGKRCPKAKGGGQSESKTRNIATDPERFPRSSIAVRPKASRTHWTYERSAGVIQIWNGSRRRYRARHHTPNPRTLTAVEHRQLDP